MVAPSRQAAASRALARAGISTLRIPEDLPVLRSLGFPENTEAGLRALKHLGLIKQVRRGLYEVREPTGRSKARLEDLLAARFGDTPHLVSGWWALGHHQLTNQHVREVVVLATRARRPMEIAGTLTRTLVTPADEIWGGRRQANGLNIAKPERALCDCVMRRNARIPAPRLAESLERFIEQSNSRDRLVRAIRKYNSPVVARRLGYLVEAVTGERWPEVLAMTGTSHRLDPLDPGDETSRAVHEWQIRTHLTLSELLEHRVVS